MLNYMLPVNKFLLNSFTACLHMAWHFSPHTHLPERITPPQARRFSHWLLYFKTKHFAKQHLEKMDKIPINCKYLQYPSFLIYLQLKSPENSVEHN